MARDFTDAELFDISDVDYEIKPSRKRNEVTIVMRAETNLNLIKIYLKLKEMIENIEKQLNILDEADGEH